MSDVLLREPEIADAADQTGKRRQILDGARTVFLSSGFDGASMNEIARVAGVSKGTLYVYFDSKEDLFEALIRLDKRAQAEQTCRVENPDADVRTVLVDLGCRLLSRILDPALVAQMRTVIAVSSKFPRIGQAFYEAGPQYGIDRLSDYFRTQVAAGQLVMDDVEQAAHYLADLCKARYVLRAVLCIDETPPSQAELRRHVTEAVDLFLKVFGPKQTG